MVDYLCKFCGKSFNREYNLQVHIKSAKYCLSLRNENPSVTYPCEHCNYESTNKYSLNAHLKICIFYKEYIIEQKDKEINEKDEIIKALREDNEKIKYQHLNHIKSIKNKQKTIDELKVKIVELKEELSYEKGMVTGIKEGVDKGLQKPTKQIVNNNNGKIINKKLANVITTHIQPLTLDYIKSKVNEYDYKTYKKGESGLTQYIENLIILNMDDGTIQKNYLCTDRSRNAFYRLVTGKEWKADGGATFINRILDSVSAQTKIHGDTLTDEIKSSKGDLKEMEFLLKLEEKLRFVYFGITYPKSKERTELFENMRNNIRDKCLITSEG